MTICTVSDRVVLEFKKSKTMKTIIPLGDSAYLFYYPSDITAANGILIIPNTAGYYAIHQKVGLLENVSASEHIDAFCACLAKRYHVYYLVLPGQDPETSGVYSYKQATESALDAFRFTLATRTLAAVIGICTGGTIAARVMVELGITSLPLILYNAAAWVGWATPRIQKKFLEKYPHVNLDCEELLTAPMPGDVFAHYPGTKILQVLGGASDYPLNGTDHRGGQREMLLANQNIEQILCNTMGDVPISTSSEFGPMIEHILEFVERK